MDLKDLIGVGTLVISAIAAWAAIEARNTAQNLEKQQFESQTTIELLGAVFQEMVASDEPEKEATSCIFVEVLGRAEADARKAPPYFVRDFIRQVDEAGLWNSDCKTRLEGVSGEKPASTVIAAVAPPTSVAKAVDSAPGGPPVEPVEIPDKIGAWHALIASYDVSPRGCWHAREDVREFSRLLSQKDLEGLFVYVVRTGVSNNYAVTVDAGDDRGRATEVSRIIRSIASKTADGKTGADSFVQGNRNWSIDPACAEFVKLDAH